LLSVLEDFASDDDPDDEESDFDDEESDFEDEESDDEEDEETDSFSFVLPPGFPLPRLSVL
jgi:hypothetical protein